MIYGAAIDIETGKRDIPKDFAITPDSLKASTTFSIQC